MWTGCPCTACVRWRDAFTPRQLVFLTTLSDLVSEIREAVLRDAESVCSSDGLSPAAGATASDYADAVATYLAFSIDKLADWSSEHLQLDTLN